MVIKSDGTGNVQWKKGYSTADREQAYAIQQTADGGYIVSGLRRIANVVHKGEIFLMKLNSDGTIKWGKRYSRED
jgi:hypothetical protein